MRVFIVLEDIRGDGTHAVGAFTSLEAANAFIDECNKDWMESGNFSYLDSFEGTELTEE